MTPPTAGRSARSSCGGGASGPSGAPWTRPCPRRCQRHQRHQRRKRRTACLSRGRAYALTSPSPLPPFAGGARGTCTPCGSACGGACAAGTTGPTQVRAGRRSGSHPPRWPPCLRPEPGVRGGGGGLGRKRRLEGRSVGVVVRVVWLLCGIWCVPCAPKQRGSVDGDWKRCRRERVARLLPLRGWINKWVSTMQVAYLGILEDLEKLRRRAAGHSVRVECTGQ